MRARGKKRPRRVKKSNITDVEVNNNANSTEIPPWLLDKDPATTVLTTRDRALALHHECLQFARFVSPMPDEHAQRQNIVDTITQIAHTVWPSCVVKPFGSFATSLYLPGGDIDLVILDTPRGGTGSEMKRLKGALNAKQGFAKAVTVIRARVPIIKFIVRAGNIPCDISFGQNGGLHCIDTVNRFVTEYPPLVPLLFVLKWVLRQYELSDPSTGGMGSFALLNIIVSHLQMYCVNFPRGATAPHVAHGANAPPSTNGSSATATAYVPQPATIQNLGTLLEDFFVLYGRMFNVHLTGIQTRDGGSYFQAIHRFPKRKIGFKDARLCVEDPNDCTNDVGKSCYRSIRICNLFKSAGNALQGWRCQPSENVSSPLTPLTTLVEITDAMRDRRASVVNSLRNKEGDKNGVAKDGIVQDVVALAALVGIEGACRPPVPSSPPPPDKPEMSGRAGAATGRQRRGEKAAQISALSKAKKCYGSHNSTAGATVVIDVDEIDAALGTEGNGRTTAGVKPGLSRGIRARFPRKRVKVGKVKEVIDLDGPVGAGDPQQTSNNVATRSRGSEVSTGNKLKKRRLQ